MDVSDEDLAAAAARGDRAAFGLLAERSYDRIHALGFRLTGCRADAEDLAQDILVSLPSKLRGWRGEARYATWLYRVTVNAARDRFRRRAAHDRAAAVWGEREVAARADSAEAEARGAWLREVMARLPEELRETLALVLTGLSHAEAGAVLQVPEGTVSWRVAEAKKRLKQMNEAEA